MYCDVNQCDAGSSGGGRRILPSPGATVIIGTRVLVPLALGSLARPGLPKLERRSLRPRGPLFVAAVASLRAKVGSGPLLPRSLPGKCAMIGMGRSRFRVGGRCRRGASWGVCAWKIPGRPGCAQPFPRAVRKFILATGRRPGRPARGGRTSGWRATLAMARPGSLFRHHTQYLGTYLV